MVHGMIIYDMFTACMTVICLPKQIFIMYGVDTLLKILSHV